VPTVPQLRHWAEMPFVLSGLAVTIIAAVIAAALIGRGDTEVPTWALAGLFAVISPLIAF
jgi:hypothetical protein